jgi:hypothetical protein
MKTLRLLPLLALLIIVTSCSTVRVASDYDKSVDFADYKTYAFYKPGIDKADISDLDKKRILRAIDAEMSAKGFTKSESPAVLVSIFTKAKERIDVYQNNWGVGNFWGAWGGPWGWGGAYGNTVSRRTDGTLYIDLIDTTKKQLIWQGQGTAPLVFGDIDKREARINEIVREIMMVYPPNMASN